MNSISKIIELINVFLVEIGELSFFGWRFLKESIKRPFELKECIRQCYYMGNRSLLLVAVTGFIIGLVFTLQSRPTLQEFGAVSWMPSMVSISIIREIGPIITALICAGRIGSGIGAELASMKVTEQIDAMEVSGTNPFKYLVVTRVLATSLMIPVLAVIAAAISLYGAYLGTNIKGVVSWQLYWTQVFDALTYSDAMPAFVKTYFFGFAIGIIGCYKGFNSSKGTEGVGQSANSAVVLSSLMVFVIDLIAVQLADLMGLT